MVLAAALRPYPASIQQGEKQLVVYEGSHLVPAAYQVASQTSTVALPSPNIESYTRLKPTSHADTTITYGPYENTPAFSVVSCNFICCNIAIASQMSNLYFAWLPIIQLLER